MIALAVLAGIAALVAVIWHLYRISSASAEMAPGNPAPVMLAARTPRFHGRIITPTVVDRTPAGPRFRGAGGTQARFSGEALVMPNAVCSACGRRIRQCTRGDECLART